MKLRTALSMAVLLVSLGEAGARDLRSAVADRGGAYKAWEYNVGIFENRAEALFRTGPAGQRAELRRRIGYALRMGAAEKKSLAGMLAAVDRLQNAPIGAGAKGKRRVALVGAAAAYERYAALFDEALHRALGLYPSAPHQRIMARWEETREERLLLAAERAFLEVAERFVIRTSALMEDRRRRFYDAVKNLQYTKDALDFTLQSQLDRAFFLLQSALSEKLEPGYGLPDYREHPVGDPFAPVLRFRPTAHAEKHSTLRYPKGAMTKLKAERTPQTPDEETLAREAHRIKELHELVSRYQEVQLGKKPEKMEALWAEYVTLRERWRKIP